MLPSVLSFQFRTASVNFPSLAARAVKFVPGTIKLVCNMIKTSFALIFAFVSVVKFAFLRISIASQYLTSEPSHKVFLSPFALAKYRTLALKCGLRTEHCEKTENSILTSVSGSFAKCGVKATYGK